MLKTIRTRIHVTPATVIATLALVLAMTGGAYAAGKYVITSTKQISPKVLKSLQGKAGPAGKNGANGSNGTPGAVGPAGPTGPTGPTGPAGTGTPGSEGKEGAPGAPGKEGSPWTAGGTLPSKATETGAWSMKAYGQTGISVALATISFTIPLAEPLSKEHVFFVPAGEEGPSPQCTGGSVEEPKASAGNLCVYVQSASASMVPFVPSPIKDPSLGVGTEAGAGTMGALILMKNEEDTVPASAYGTWAVTAP